MGAPFTLPYRTTPDTLDAVRADLNVLLSITPHVLAEANPASLAEAQARFARRAMETAAEHGVALLAALDMPRLVEADFTPLDPVAIADAIDLAIAALDDLDGDADAEEPDDEPTGDDELSLGWTAKVDQVHLGQDQDDHETTALERHGKGFFRSGPDDAEDDDGCGDEDSGIGDVDGYHEQCGFAVAGALPWSVGGYVA